MFLEALFPSAYRIRRGTVSLQNPAFQRSPGDADLLFEVSFHHVGTLKI